MHSRYIRAILAIFFVAGVASASFYISTKISSNKSVSPNAPESNAQAANNKKDKCAGVVCKSNEKCVGDGRCVWVNPAKSEDTYICNPQICPAPCFSCSADKKSCISNGCAGVAANGIAITPTIVASTGTSGGKGQYSPTEYIPSPTTSLIATPTIASGAFGSTDTSSGQSYMSIKANNCTDGLGFVSGTGCFNGERRVLNIETTQQAYRQHVERIKNGLVSKSNKELLDEAGTPCNPSNENCQGKLADARKKMLEKNIVLDAESRTEITKIQTQNQALQDVINVSLSNTYLKNTYGSDNPQTILNNLGVNPTTVTATLAERKTLFEEKERQNSANKIVTLSNNNLQNFATLFADPAISDADLAKEYCKGNPNVESCTSKFKRTDVLSALDKSSEDYKNVLATRQKNLSNLIPQVVGSVTNPNLKLDAKTKQEIEKINQDIQNAFAAYANTTQGKSESTILTSDQLAKRFGELINKDSKFLDTYLAIYDKDPKKYTTIVTAPIGTKDNNINVYTIKPKLEENAIITLEYKEIIANSPIKGLAENGKVNDWKNVDSTYKEQVRELACKADKNQCPPSPPSRFNPISPETYQERLTAYDNKLTDKEKLLTQIYNEKTGAANPLSTFQSNIATIDNSAVNSDLRKAALDDAQKQLNPYVNTRFQGNYQKPEINDPRIIEVANEYINRRAVEETYKMGGGVTSTLAVAGIATAMCGGNPICGAVGAFAGAASNFVPILGEKTAKEISADIQNIKDFTFWGLTDKKIFNNDTVASLMHASYTNQGAWGENGPGASITTKDNPFALLANIQATNQNLGTTVDSLADPTIQANIAIQPFLNQEFDALQVENRNQAYVNLAVAPVVGYISGNVASNIFSQAKNASPTLISIAKNVAQDSAMWLGGTAVNDIQTQVQFNQTSKFVDTQSEIDLELCKRQNGSNNCDAQQRAVNDETQQAKNDARLQAFISDAVIQAGQTSTSLAVQINNYAHTLANSTPNTRTNTTPSSTPPTDSVIISPQLARELYNIDRKILSNLEESVYLSKLNEINNAIKTNGTGLSDSQAKSNNLTADPTTKIITQDVQQIAQEYRIRNTQGDITPEEATLIATVIKNRVEKISGTPTSLKNLTSLQLQDLNNLAKKISDPTTTPEDKSLFTQVLNSQIDRYLNGNEKIYNATIVKANTEDITDLKKITGLDDGILAQVTDGEVTPIRPLMDEYNSPNTKIERKIALATEIITEITSGKETPNFIVPSELASNNKPIDINNLPDDAPFIIPNDSEDASLAQTPPSSPKVTVIGRPEPIVLDIAPRTTPGPRSSRNSANTTSAPPPKKPNKISSIISEAIIPPTITNKNSSLFFKPNDNIYQAMPGGSNIIGKIPGINTENNNPVYYRVSGMDMGHTTSVTRATKLTDNFNPLPTNGKPYLLEFGTIDSKGNFVKLNPSPKDGTQTLSMNISNEYSFGKPNTSDQTPKPKTNPIKTGVQTAKNVVVSLPEKAGLPVTKKPTTQITPKKTEVTTKNLGAGVILTTTSHRFQIDDQTNFHVTVEEWNNGTKIAYTLNNQYLTSGTTVNIKGVNYVLSLNNTYPSLTATKGVSKIFNSFTPKITLKVNSDGTSSFSIPKRGNIDIGLLHNHEFGKTTKSVNFSIKKLLTTGSLDPIKITILNGKIYTVDGANKIRAYLENGIEKVPYQFTEFKNLEPSSQLIVTEINKNQTVIGVAVPSFYSKNIGESPFGARDYPSTTNPKKPFRLSLNQNDQVKVIKIVKMGITVFFGEVVGIVSAFFIASQKAITPNNQQIILTPTPTAIYASPTPTNISANPSPTVTLTLVPTNVAVDPNLPSKINNIPAEKTLDRSQMSEFGNTAKLVGQAIINCQSKGFINGPELSACFCSETANGCTEGSIEKRLSDKLLENSMDGNLLQCVEFVNIIEIIKKGNLVTNGNYKITEANQMNNNLLNNYYRCPQSAVARTGFTSGDVLVWQGGKTGHTSICAEANGDSCNTIESNKKEQDSDPENGIVQFRDVNSKDSFDAVYRYVENPSSPLLQGCEFKEVN